MLFFYEALYHVHSYKFSPAIWVIFATAHHSYTGYLFINHNFKYYNIETICSTTRAL